jgi:hypothetical protein
MRTRRTSQSRLKAIAIVAVVVVLAGVVTLRETPGAQAEPGKVAIHLGPVSASRDQSIRIAVANMGDEQVQAEVVILDQDGSRAVFEPLAEPWGEPGYTFNVLGQLTGAEGPRGAGMTEATSPLYGGRPR